VTAVAIARGAVITRPMLTTKAPARTRPARLAEVTGRRARVDIPADTTIIEGPR
jgi:hypothetical protein